MEANEQQRNQQNSRTSRATDFHRRSQHIQHALQQWYNRQVSRQDDRPGVHQPQYTASSGPLQQNAVAGQPEPHHPDPLITYHVVRRPRQGIMTKLPAYLQRGTTVCCGCRIAGASILLLFVLGSVMVFIGIFALATGYSGNSGFILLGGFLLVIFYVLICRKARKEFEALPPNHHDRLYYSSSERHHVRVLGNSQLPPNTQVVHFSSSANSHPSSPTQVVQLPPLGPSAPLGSRTGLPPEAQMGHFPTPPDTPQRPGSQSRAPPYESLGSYDDDKPPAYEDIFKDV